MKQYYNLVGVGDISLTLNYNIWSYRVTKYQLNKIFKRYVDKNIGNVLDIGSGTGFVIDIWQKFNKSITGIDISRTAIERLIKKYPQQTFFEVDAGKEELPFEDNSMQAVSASSVLYHIIEDDCLERLLQNTHRVLKSEGVFIFSDNFIHHQHLSISHQKCRTLEYYEAALLRNGFEIIDRVPNYVLFNDPVDSNKKLYPRIWYLITRLSKKWKWFDLIIWPMLFPLEIVLTSVLKESPAQEIIICKVKK